MQAKPFQDLYKLLYNTQKTLKKKLNSLKNLKLDKLFKKLKQIKLPDIVDHIIFST